MIINLPRIYLSLFLKRCDGGPLGGGGGIPMPNNEGLDLKLGRGKMLELYAGPPRPNM